MSIFQKHYFIKMGKRKKTHRLFVLFSIYNDFCSKKSAITEISAFCSCRGSVFVSTSENFLFFISLLLYSSFVVYFDILITIFLFRKINIYFEVSCFLLLSIRYNRSHIEMDFLFVICLWFIWITFLFIAFVVRVMLCQLWIDRNYIWNS